MTPTTALPRTALPHADLFAALDEAEIASAFATITGETDTLRAAEAEINALSAEAINRGFILATSDCEVGDEVQNNHGDTGTVTSLTVGSLNIVEVRWDAPTPHPTRFTTAHLFAGALRHRR